MSSYNSLLEKTKLFIKENYKHCFFVSKMIGSTLVGLLLNLGIFALASFSYSMGGEYFFIFLLIAVILESSIVIRNRAAYADFVLQAKKYREHVETMTCQIEKSYKKHLIFSFVMMWIELIVLLALVVIFAVRGVLGGVLSIVLILLAMVVTSILECRHIKAIQDFNLGFPHTARLMREPEVDWNREIRAIVIASVILFLLFLRLSSEAIMYGAWALSSFCSFVRFSIILCAIICFVVRCLGKKYDEQIKLLQMKNRLTTKDNSNIVMKQAQQANAVKSNEDTVSAQTSRCATNTIPDIGGFEQPRRVEVKSLSLLCDDFLKYSREHGLTLDETTAKELIAALSASRGLWLRGGDIKHTQRVAEMFSYYFTGSCIALSANVATEQGLFKGDKYNSLLTRKLCQINAYTDCINTIVFGDVKEDLLLSVFPSFLNYFAAPEGDNSICVDCMGSSTGNKYIKDGCIKLPANLWGIFVVEENQTLPKKYREFISEVYIKAEEDDEKLCNFEMRDFLPSYASFIGALRDAQQEDYLSLDIWKKIDKVEEYLAQSLDFKISNPMARQMEEYATALLTCGIPAEVVTDKVIASRILPFVIDEKKETINSEGCSFVELLDGLFGIDNLAISNKILSETNLC